ncbi:hypothetical protein ACRRVB_02795 [Candidatus Cardinium hertigii]|uniref:hypothetical protein n=1 Tax=Candidatus Cardinium hertigii TaxID=247481 RepID=UPI003D7C5BA1
MLDSTEFNLDADLFSDLTRINSDTESKETTEDIITNFFSKWNTLGNNIIICDLMVYIPDIEIKDDIFKFQEYEPTKSKMEYDNWRTSVDKMVEKGNTIIEEYLKNRDDELAKKNLGYGNTIFHFLALVSAKTPIDINHLGQIYSGDDTVFTALNNLGQSSIEIALLSKNKDFIQFFVESVKDLENYSSKSIDKYGNKIGHILARAYTNDLEEILTMLSPLENIRVDIITQVNALGRSALYDAVQYSNTEFINWWNEHAGEFTIVDKDGETLWHELCKKRNKIDDTGVLSNIYDMLKGPIKHLVNQPDKLGRTPIQVALSSPVIFEWLLRDFIDNIDLNHKDKEGNTITHMMAYNIIDDTNYQYINYRKTIVNLLIPHRDTIKKNYDITNIYEKRPIDIIESFIDRPFPIYIHHKVSFDIIKNIALNKGFYEYGSGSSVSSVSGDYRLQFSPSTKSTQSTELDDRLVFFSDMVLQEMNNVEKLGEPTIDIIHALLLDIIYSDVNNYGDKLAHFLLSTELLEVSKEITLVHILKTIEKINPELIEVIYDTPNQLGQFLSHLAIESDCNSVFYYGVQKVPRILSQLSQIKNDKIPPNISNIAFYTSDYAIFLKNYAAIDYLISFSSDMQKHNTNFRIPCNIPSYYLDDIGLKDFKKHLSISSVFKDQDIESIIDTYIKNIINTRIYNLNKGNAYYPILASHVPTFEMYTNRIMKSKYNSVVLYEKGFSTVCSLSTLASTLKQHIDTNRPTLKMISIALIDEGHASALVVLKDMEDQFHAIIVDYQSHLYKKNNQSKIATNYRLRLNAIKKILFETLKIKEDYIHQFNIEQQGPLDHNCVLWTIANIKFIEYCFIKQIAIDGSTEIRTDYWRSSTYEVSSDILRDIEDTMQKSVPYILEEIQKFVIASSNNRQASTTPLLINFDKIIYDSQKQRYLHQPWYLYTPLESSTILEVVAIYDTNRLFSPEGYNRDYENISNQLLTVNDDKRFEKSLEEFIRSNKNRTNARCTFIMNSERNYWATLVVDYKNNEYKSYYADGYDETGEKPQNIINILNKHLSTGVKIFNTQHGHYLYNYNSGFWAIQDAFDINVVLNDKTAANYLNNNNIRLSEALEHLNNPNNRIILDSKYDFRPMRQELYETIKKNIKFLIEKKKKDQEHASISTANQDSLTDPSSMEVEETDIPEYICSMKINRRRKRSSNTSCIPTDVIKEIFYANVKTPYESILNDNLFSSPEVKISLRIDTLHKELLKLNTNQLKLLKGFIKEHKIPLDETFINNIPKDQIEEKKIIVYYRDEIKKRLYDDKDILTVEDLSHISYAAIEKRMSDHNIPSDIQDKLFKRLDIIHEKSKKYLDSVGNIANQGLFFAPDIIKSINYNDYKPLLVSLGMIGGDISINVLRNKLVEGTEQSIEKAVRPTLQKIIPNNNKLVDVLEPHLQAGTKSLFKNPVYNNIICKTLTIYSIYRLISELNQSTSPSEKQRLIHKLGEQGVTLGLLIAESISYEIPGAWPILIVEQLLYDADQEINVPYRVFLFKCVNIF